MIERQTKAFEAGLKTSPAIAEDIKETAVQISEQTDLNIKEIKIKQIYAQRKIKKIARAKASGII